MNEALRQLTRRQILELFGESAGAAAILYAQYKLLHPYQTLEKALSKVRNASPEDETAFSSLAPSPERALLDFERQKILGAALLNEFTINKTYKSLSVWADYPMPFRPEEYSVNLVGIRNQQNEATLMYFDTSTGTERTHKRINTNDITQPLSLFFDRLLIADTYTGPIFGIVRTANERTRDEFMSLLKESLSEKDLARYCPNKNDINVLIGGALNKEVGMYRLDVNIKPQSKDQPIITLTCDPENGLLVSVGGTEPVSPPTNHQRQFQALAAQLPALYAPEFMKDWEILQYPLAPQPNSA